MINDIAHASPRTFGTFLPQSSALTRLRYAPNLHSLTHSELYRQYSEILSFEYILNTLCAYPDFSLHAERLLARSVTDGECRVWQRGATADGYGQIMVQKVWWTTHLLAFRTWMGAAPPNTVLDHLCRNRRCINPLHLEPVSLAENTRRGLACNLNKARCKRGHELAGAGKCAECQRLNQRAWYERTRAA